VVHEANCAAALDCRVNNPLWAEAAKGLGEPVLATVSNCTQSAMVLDRGAIGRDTDIDRQRGREF